MSENITEDQKKAIAIFLKSGKSFYRAPWNLVEILDPYQERGLRKLKGAIVRGMGFEDLKKMAWNLHLPLSHHTYQHKGQTYHDIWWERLFIYSTIGRGESFKEAFEKAKSSILKE